MLKLVAVILCALVLLAASAPAPEPKPDFFTAPVAYAYPAYTGYSPYVVSPYYNYGLLGYSALGYGYAYPYAYYR